MRLEVYVKIRARAVERKRIEYKNISKAELSEFKSTLRRKSERKKQVKNDHQVLPKTNE